MHARGDVRPPEKGLDVRRAVVGADFELDDGPARMEADAVHPLHPRHGIVVAAPDGLRAVGMFLDFKIHRQKRRGPVVLRPVELDAAAGPWPGETDQRGLDDRLVVNQVIAVGLVLDRVDASAQFRQDQRADEFVFNPDGFPFPVHRFFRNAVGEGQGIDFAAAALIDALFQKHRVFIRGGGQIGGDDQIFSPGAHDGFLAHVRFGKKLMPELTGTALGVNGANTESYG